VLVKVSFNDGQLSILLALLPVFDENGAINQNLFSITFLVVVENGVRHWFICLVQISILFALKQN